MTACVDWIEEAPALLMGLAVVFVPGAMITLALRVRGFAVLALSPVISLTLVGMGAVVAGWARIPWSWAVPFLGGAVIAAGIFLLCRRLPTLPGLDWPRSGGKDPGQGPVGSSWRGEGFLWGGYAIAVVVLSWILLRVIGDPQNFSQTYDNSFHLNAVRWIAETRDGSSLTLTSMTTSGKPPYFYPAGWHDAVSLVFMSTGATVPAATNAMILITGAMVYPAGMLWLIRTMTRLRPGTLLVAGALVAGFSAFPLLPISFGVLYPNFMGEALLPSLLGLVLNLLRLAPDRQLSTVQSLVLGGVGVMGAALVHPSALMSLVVITLPMLFIRGWRQGRAMIRKELPLRSFLLQLAGLVGCLGIFWVLWSKVRPADRFAVWKPETDFFHATVEAVFTSPMGTYHPELLVSALILIGVVTILRTRRSLLWVVAAYALLLWLYIAVRALDFDAGRTFFTGIWYNDAYRLAALVPIIGVPLSVIGVEAVMGFLQHRFAGPRHGTEETITATAGIPEHLWAPSPALPLSADSPAPEAPGPEAAPEHHDAPVPRRTGASALPRRTRPTELSWWVQTSTRTAAVMLAVILLGTQAAQPMRHLVADTHQKYLSDADSPLVDDHELDVIQHIDQFVAPNEQVLETPRKGGAVIYALAGRRVPGMHIAFDQTGDFMYLKEHLNQAYTDPKVCEAVDRGNYRFLAWFPGREITDKRTDQYYTGWENLVDSGVATEVYRSGDAALLKIVAC